MKAIAIVVLVVFCLLSAVPDVHADIDIGGVASGAAIVGFIPIIGIIVVLPIYGIINKLSNGLQGDGPADTTNTMQGEAVHQADNGTAADRIPTAWPGYI